MALFVLPSRRVRALDVEVRELQERLWALQRQVDEQGGRLKTLTAVVLSIYDAQRPSGDREKAVPNVVH